jgi:hypothetical protein
MVQVYVSAHGPAPRQAASMSRGRTCEKQGARRDGSRRAPYAALEAPPLSQTLSVNARVNALTERID